MQDIKGKILRGTVWVVVSRIFINLLGLVSTLTLARLLTPGDFGLVSLASVALVILGAFTELSLSSALIHLQTVEDEHYHTAWTLSVVRAFLVSLCLCGLAYPMAVIYKDERLIGLMMAIAASTFVLGALNPKLAILSKQLDFRQEFIIGVGAKLIGLITALIIAYVYRSYWALILGSAASNLFSTVISYVIYPYLPKISFSKFKELFSFSSWLTLGQAINTVNWNLDPLFLGWFSKHQLGIYSFGCNLASLPTREAINPLGRILFPSFVALVHDPERLKAAYIRAQSTLSFVAFPIGVGFAFVVDPLVRLTVGDKWAEAIPIIQVFTVISAILVMSMPVHSIAMAVGQTRKLFFRDLGYTAVRVPMIIIGLWLGGLQGLVIAVAISGLIGMVIEMRVVKEIVGIAMLRQFSINLRSFSGVIVMAGCVAALQHSLHLMGAGHDKIWNIVASVAVGAVAYGVAMAMIWWLAGKPRGPETEIVGIIGQLRKRGVVKA